METPFSVSYYLDEVGQRHFSIEQDRNIVNMLPALAHRSEVARRPAKESDFVYSTLPFAFCGSAQ
ncbi:hypothetical protein TELCIR_09623 [Teladorsagia circumcincta]|uniref:Uncharacterized protein n=1 Tax=Teladorsagia circumcincta TaxID=45464 RepID=A0A2G9UEB1_TELCI|nr:hypothetical protein TELCIR_09623 [Teladorsagia circumcincta]